MTCSIQNKFQNITRYTDNLILNTLEVNLKYFLDYAFLNIGAWTDISAVSQPQISPSLLSKLSLLNDPSYTLGQVWQTNRKEIIWEDDISFETYSPIFNPQIYVNNNLNTNLNIDYLNGRIIFNNPINSSSDVRATYSYRNIQVYRSSDAPWWQLLQSNSFEPNDIVLNNNDWSIGPHHRIQMPCIVIDSVSRSQNLPFELGNTSLVIEQDVIFNILAQTKNERNQLLDILRVQQDNTIWLYDINKAAKNNKLPLDHNGYKNLAGFSYNNLVNNFKWGKVYFKKIVLSEVESININLYEGLVRVTFEIIFDGFNV